MFISGIYVIIVTDEKHSNEEKTHLFILINIMDTIELIYSQFIPLKKSFADVKMKQFENGMFFA